MKYTVFAVLGLAWLTSTSLCAESDEKSANAATSIAEKSHGSKSQVSDAQPAKASLGMLVTGNEESPKVLYIVPWKSLDDEVALPRVSPFMAMVFAPLDPEVFKRQVSLHRKYVQPLPALSHLTQAD